MQFSCHLTASCCICVCVCVKGESKQGREKLPIYLFIFKMPTTAKAGSYQSQKCAINLSPSCVQQGLEHFAITYHFLGCT